LKKIKEVEYIPTKQDIEEEDEDAAEEEEKLEALQA